MDIPVSQLFFGGVAILFAGLIVLPLLARLFSALPYSFRKPLVFIGFLAGAFQFVAHQLTRRRQLTDAS